MCRNWIRHLTNDNINGQNKQQERCSASLVSRETQNKTKMRYSTYFTKMIKILLYKHQQNQVFEK
jgi:hypothetical protein